MKDFILGLILVALAWGVLFICIWLFRLFYNETISEEGNKRGLVMAIMFVVILVLLSLVYALIPNIEKSIFSALVFFLLSIFLFGFWAMCCDGYGKRIREQESTIRSLKNKLGIKNEEN